MYIFAINRRENKRRARHARDEKSTSDDLNAREVKEYREREEEFASEVPFFIRFFPSVDVEW